MAELTWQEHRTSAISYSSEETHSPSAHFRLSSAVAFLESWPKALLAIAFFDLLGRKVDLLSAFSFGKSLAFSFLPFADFLGAI